MHTTKIISAAVVIGALAASCSTAAEAQEASASSASSAADEGFIDSWMARVREAQDSQPHWITPLATVTPRLEQEFRYDQLWQHSGNGADLTNSDGGKGLELIPTTSNEVIVNLPPYEERRGKKPASGWGDWPALLIKQRFVSANEANGNYIVSGFLGVQAPNGSAAFTNHAWMITPTLAAGKGWGNFDIQATVGVPIPLSHESAIGTSVVTNLAAQYHLGGLFWPELEANATSWTDGPRAGKTQVFLTPGLILGRFPLVGHTKAIIGLGYQVAVTPTQVLKPVLTPTFQNGWILSLRGAF